MKSQTKVIPFGKRGLASMERLRTSYERAGWAVTIDVVARTMTAVWSGRPRRRHNKGAL